jgi:tetratricopeptide (TPR) repeat protein
MKTAFKMAAAILAVAIVFWSTAAYAEETATVTWEKDFDSAVKAAKDVYTKSNGEDIQIVVVIFYEPDDENSKEFLEKTMKDPGVVAMCKDYRLVKIDTKQDQKLFREHGLSHIPAYICFNHDGERLDGMQGSAPGPKKFKDFIGKMDTLSQNYYETKAELKDNPDDPEIHIKIGIFWLDVKQPDTAKKSFETALAKAGDKAGPKAKATFYLGRVESMKRNQDKALELFKKAVELDPKNESGMLDQFEFRVAMIPAETNLFQKAITALEAFLKKYPESKDAANALYTLGVCYNSQNDPKKAREMWKRCADEYPESEYGQRSLRLINQEAETGKSSGKKE